MEAIITLAVILSLFTIPVLVGVSHMQEYSSRQDSGWYRFLMFLQGFSYAVVGCAAFAAILYVIAVILS